MSTQNKKVYVGLSGGVDSSVSAYLLKERGYDVTGVFIKVWQPDFIECTWREDRLDAMRVAAELDIPFITLDLEKEYKEGVIDYMISEYRQGRIPNPDVFCNKEVKFGAFYDFAMKEGVDYVATGHYVQNIWNEEKKYFEVCASQDANKDQGYFLWNITGDQLEHVLFPIGGYTKEEVRNIAEEANLYTKNKKDSQGLCFIGQIDIKDFLKEYITTKEGEVLNEEDVVIGTHDGALLYALGERHGFTIHKKGTDDTPYFIYKKDIETNKLWVTHNYQELSRDIVALTACNWIHDYLVVGDRVQVRIRHRGTKHQAIVTELNQNFCTLKLETKEYGVNNGQSAVLFKGDLLLGGGIIDKLI